MTPSDLKRLDARLDALHLSHVKSHYQAFATTAAQKQVSHIAYLAELIEGEAARRETHAIARRINEIDAARADLRPTYLYQLERMVEAHRAFRARTVAAYQAQKTAKSSTAARPKPARAARKR